MTEDPGRPERPSEPKPIDPKQPLSGQTGFWQRVRQHKKLRDSDILHLRDDMKRMLELVAKAAAGGKADEELAEEIRGVRETVEADFGTMSLVLQTLIEILIEKNVMSEDEFETKMEEIDLRDGRRDGTLQPPGRPSERNQRKSE